MHTHFKWRHFQCDVILWAVRWSCRYGISYRDLEQMMTERGVPVDHSTIHRWVQKSDGDGAGSYTSLIACKSPSCLLGLIEQESARTGLVHFIIMRKRSSRFVICNRCPLETFSMGDFSEAISFPIPDIRLRCCIFMDPVTGLPTFEIFVAAKQYKQAGTTEGLPGVKSTLGLKRWLLIHIWRINQASLLFAFSLC